MMRSLYETSPIVRQTLNEADAILGMELSQLMMNGSTVKLNKISHMLLAICVASVAHYRLYTCQTDIQPAYMAGHSLGEYSALICGGALSFEDGLKLIRFRSKLAEEVMGTTGGGMSIIKQVDPAKVEMLCAQLNCPGKEISIACYNSPSQVTVSGIDEVLRELEQRVSDGGGQVTYLIGSAPYHCELMRPQAEKMAQELGQYHLQMPSLPIISNVTGRPYRSVKEMMECLPQQLFRPVLWNKSIQYLLDRGTDLFLELGPQSILKILLSETSSHVKAYAHDDKGDRVRLAHEHKQTSDKERRLTIQQIHEKTEIEPVEHGFEALIGYEGEHR